MGRRVHGSSDQTFTQQCTRLSSLLPSWPSLLLTVQLPLTPPPQLTLQLQHITNPLHTRRRNSPLNHSLTSTESLMTTARPTSRSPRPKTETVLSPDLSSSLFPTAESRPPHIPLITSTDSSLMWHTREPQSTHQSQRRDTETPPLTLLPLTSPPQLTSQLPKMLGGS